MSLDMPTRAAKAAARLARDLIHLYKVQSITTDKEPLRDLVAARNRDRLIPKVFDLHLYFVIWPTVVLVDNPHPVRHGEPLFLWRAAATRHEESIASWRLHDHIAWDQRYLAWLDDGLLPREQIKADGASRFVGRQGQPRIDPFDFDLHGGV